MKSLTASPVESIVVRIATTLRAFEQTRRYRAPHQTFDDIAETLGSGMPRRKALKLVLVGLAGAALAEFGVRSSWAASSCLCEGVSYDPNTACCTPYGIQAKHPIKTLAYCPDRVKTHDPNYDPPFNGCGPAGGAITPYVPNQFGLANFLDCCNVHDVCYGTCKNVKNTCDNTFGTCLLSACSPYLVFLGEVPELYASCLAVADIYYLAVSLGGAGAFDSGQDVACDCCNLDVCCPDGGCVGFEVVPCGGDPTCLCNVRVEGGFFCRGPGIFCEEFGPPPYRSCLTDADCQGPLGPEGVCVSDKSCCQISELINSGCAYPCGFTPNSRKG